MRQVSDRNIASVIRRIYDKLVQAIKDKIVRQMRTIVSYELHLRLKDHFEDCYHSL